jgi:hypothetical protein
MITQLVTELTLEAADFQSEGHSSSPSALTNNFNNLIAALLGPILS